MGRMVVAMVEVVAMVAVVMVMAVVWMSVPVDHHILRRRRQVRQVGLRKVGLVGRHGPGCLGFLEVVERLFGGAALRLAQVRRPGKRHVEDLGGRQIFRVRLVQVVVALGVLGDAVVGAHAGGDLSRGDARDLEATFLFHLSSSGPERLLRLQLSLREEVQALWRRRLWSGGRRCCRRCCRCCCCGSWRRLEQRWRLEILGGGGGGIIPDAGTCCIESRGAATTPAAPSREQSRVRHLPSTDVCSSRGGGGLGRLVHCVGYRRGGGRRRRRRRRRRRVQFPSAPP